MILENIKFGDKLKTHNEQIAIISKHKIIIEI